MNDLAKFQNAMHDLVFHRETSETHLQSISQVLSDYSPEELRERLSIYQNNTYYSLVEAVKDLYPSVVATIGDELVSACAREWLGKNPPKTAAMVEFGEGFDTYLSVHPSMEKFAYIGDLARLDLLQHQSYHAKDDAPLSAEAIAQIQPETLAASRVTQIASAFLLKSEFAVFDIWQLANQHIDREIDASQEQSVLIIRPQFEVQVYLLEPALYTFLNNLQNQNTLQIALETAAGEDSDFNPTLAIQFLVQSGFCKDTTGE